MEIVPNGPFSLVTVLADLLCGSCEVCIFLPRLPRLPFLLLPELLTLLLFQAARLPKHRQSWLWENRHFAEYELLDRSQLSTRLKTPICSPLQLFYTRNLTQR